MADSRKAKKKESAFRFMDLPAEIRCLIYEYLLRGKCPIQVISDYPKKNSRAQATIYGLCKPEIWTAIIHVNRQVYEEAAPILYGANVFQTEYSKEAQFFVKGIGHHVRFLQHVGFEKCVHNTKTYLTQLVQTLQSAKSLKTLDLPIQIVAAYKPAQLARELLPLFKLLQGSQNFIPGKKARVISQTFAKYPQPPLRDRVWEAELEASWTEVKMLLAKALGEDNVEA